MKSFLSYIKLPKTINSLLSLSFVNKFKIPTLLGIGLIVLGIGAGVFLVMKEQLFISKASPDIVAKNITNSNISDSEISIFWETSIPVASFISYGQAAPDEQAALDDRDSKIPQPHSVHFVTIKNLMPKTIYQFKIVSGKLQSEIKRFTTAAPINQPTTFRPIIGSLIYQDKPLDEGVIYLSIAGATIQSSLIKASGNFLIPLSQIRNDDLSDVYALTEGTEAKLTVVSDKGRNELRIKLKSEDNTLPPLKLGLNSDLIKIESHPKPASPSASDLKKYDLNNDGKINATDNAIILQNIGRKPKDSRIDLNGDGIIDQKDLDLMAKQINQ